MKNIKKRTKSTPYKKRERNNLSVKEIKFLNGIKSYGLLEAMEDLSWAEEDIIEHLESNIFKKEYYKVLGLNEKQVKFLQIFAKKLANVRQTCIAVNISRNTYYRWMRTNQIFATEIEGIEEGLYDDAESIIYHKIFVDKDTTSLIFFMKTKMKHRGYVERQELNANIKGQMEVKSEYAGKTIAELDEIERELRKKAGLL